MIEAPPTPENASDIPDLPPPAAKKNSRYKALLIIAGVFLLLGAVGGFWWISHAGIEKTDNATLEGHIHPVSARVGGTVQKVLVDENQLVEEGQVLVILDPTEYEIALSQAKHNLEVAKSQANVASRNIAVTQRQAASQLSQAQGTVGMSQSGVMESRQAVQEAAAAVETARQGVAQQDANYQRAAADYQRYAGLDPDAVSAQQLDAARTNMQVAEAARNAAKASLEQAQARVSQAQAAITTSVARTTQAKGTYQGAQAQGLQVDVVKSQYENALAQIKVAEDQVRQAELNLSYTEIRAASSGRIGRKTVEVGQRIQPSEPLMSVVPDRIWVVANFKETQLRKMLPGQPVEIEVDAYPDHKFHGTLESFSPASGAQFALLPPENATGNFTKIVQRIPVRIQFKPDSLAGYEKRLIPGMSVLVSVNTNHQPEGDQP